MKILFIGDIVGKPGRELVRKGLRPLVEREEIDLVNAFLAVELYFKIIGEGVSGSIMPTTGAVGPTGAFALAVD